MSTLEATAVANGTPAPPDNPERGSLLAGLRAKRQQILDQEPLNLPVPGYSGELIARYRPIAWEKGQEAINRANKDADNPRAILNVWADELIFSCVGIYARNGEQIAASYGPDLADALGFEATSAREALYGAFGDPAPSDEPHDDNGAGVRMSAHHTKVLEWMRGEADDENDAGAIGRGDEEAQGE